MTRLTKRAGLLASVTSGLAALAALTSLTSLTALGACSSSDDATDPPAPGEDASTVIVPRDGGADVVVDAAVDAPLDGEAGARVCSDDHFCHTVVPKGQNLRSVWGDGQGVVWAVSVEGNILRWDGTSWTIHMHVTKESGVYSVFGTGPTDVWVPTELGLLHGTGATPATLVFAPVTLPGDAKVLVKTVWGTGPNDLWAFGGTESFDAPPFAVGRALHYGGPTGDGGTGWTLDAALSSRGIAFRGAWGSAGSGVWVQGGAANELGEFTGVVLRREPGATTWKTVTLPADPDVPYHPGPQYIVGASLSSDSSVWLGGFSGDFVPAFWHGTKVTDGGTGFDWTLSRRSFWDRPVIALWGTAPNDTWAVGQDGLVARWNGATWTQAVIRVTELPLVKTFWGIWGKSNDDFWVVGDEVALHKTTANKP